MDRAAAMPGESRPQKQTAVRTGKEGHESQPNGAEDSHGRVEAHFYYNLRAVSGRMDRTMDTGEKGIAVGNIADHPKA